MRTAVSSFVTHRGHRIACLSYPNPAATALPVVWVHGLTASYRFWEVAMYPEVWRERAWYSVSLPLHYPSSFTEAASVDGLTRHLDEQLFAELLAEPIRALLPEGKFHLVGYSLGAFSCLNYTAKYPQRVASVISIGGFMTGRARGLEGVLQFFAQGNLVRRALFHTGWWILQRHVVFLKLATLFYARRWRRLLQYPLLDPTLEAIFPDVRQHPIGGQQALFRYLLDMNLMDEIDDIRTPVCVIAGDRDPIIPYAHQREYAARLQAGHFVRLPGVGHVAFAEAPEVFHRTVVNWLAAHD
ncbi:2-succinyl-6-hydroxy-2, 4-cyclohexadiene-1-carboxylate synthase [Neolewinella maritima]|uniref:2-succinyl-6-hydroxy-2, 4-cyclohexadiene-1-carboxylate synthase n=1 Tax=Neolewinella maritima TaxID=1383882 RepID=A0ABM9AY30_9BACT|nr:alpha/beta hydrolase [Neolewinella maritima]CAH0999413.1 2-succinyl-6-hydroxy-2, 4-cyclohexadiene-1-carboxylate synthase [Neolewinella maritima]